MKAMKFLSLVLIIICSLFFLYGCGSADTGVKETTAEKVVYPWEVKDAKKPSEYTWAEFEALNGEEQIAFQKSFGSIKKFDKWLQKAQADSFEDMWQNGEKKPSDYTWEEFEAMSGEEQIAFQKSFGSIEKFDEWLQEAQSLKLECPWEKEGEKQPSEYSWEEFEALDAQLQMAFQKSFDSIDDFDKWLTANKP